MNMKKITAAALAAALMAGTVSVTASADYYEIGSFATPIDLGEKVSDTIPYDESGHFYYTTFGNDYYYEDDKNYKDYKITVHNDGTLLIAYDANIGSSVIRLYRDDTKVAMDNQKITTTTGDNGSTWLYWNENVGIYAGVIQYEVVKGDHFIRVGRVGKNGDGTLGYGTINLTAQMKYAGDANGDGKVNATDATAVLKHVVEINKLSGFGLVNADANGDGKINATDATTILKQVVGLS